MPTVEAGPELVALIALVAGITEAVKRIAFPDAWHYGRAPLILAALLALLGTIVNAWPLTSTSDPIELVTTWLAVYTGAVGAHQTVTKAPRVATGTTNPAGPDPGA